MEPLLLRPKAPINLFKDSMSPSFKSQSPRHLLLSQNQTPGPGSYGIPSLDYQKTAKYHVNSQKKSDVKKDFQWILSNTRSKGFVSGDRNICLGPGSYQLKDGWHSKHPFWSKCSRFSNKHKDLSLPGPGYYNPNSSQVFQSKRSAIAAFKSRSPKSFLERVGTQGQEGSKKRRVSTPVREQKQVDQKCKKDEKQTSSFFSSKVPRFLTQSTPGNIGPGSYDLTPSSSTKRNDIIKIIRRSNPALDSQKKQATKLRVSSQVGPGCYNLSKQDIGYGVQYKGTSFAKDTRFNFNSRKNRLSAYLPGPGQYMQQKYVYLHPEDDNRKGIQNRQRIFSQKYSKIIASDHNIRKRKNKVEQTSKMYNVNNFDIDFKLRKKMEHKQKLNIMDVSLAAFDSKVPRF